MGHGNAGPRRHVHEVRLWPLSGRSTHARPAHDAPRGRHRRDGNEPNAKRPPVSRRASSLQTRGDPALTRRAPSASCRPRRRTSCSPSAWQLTSFATLATVAFTARGVVGSQGDRGALAIDRLRRLGGLGLGDLRLRLDLRLGALDLVVALAVLSFLATGSLLTMRFLAERRCAPSSHRAPRHSNGPCAAASMSCGRPRERTRRKCKLRRPRSTACAAAMRAAAVARMVRVTGCLQG